MLAADPYADAEAVQNLGAELLPLDAMLPEADPVVVSCLLNERRATSSALLLAQLRLRLRYLRVLGVRRERVDALARRRGGEEGRVQLRQIARAVFDAGSLSASLARWEVRALHGEVRAELSVAVGGGSLDIMS